MWGTSLEHKVDVCRMILYMHMLSLPQPLPPPPANLWAVVYFSGAFFQIIGHASICLFSSRAGYYTLDDVRMFLRVGLLLWASVGLS